MPAAVAAPAAVAGGGAILSAISGDMASRRQAQALRDVANIQGSFSEGGPYLRPLRADMSGSLQDYLGGGDIFSGDTNNLVSSRIREYLSDPSRLEDILSGKQAYDMLDTYRANTQGGWEQDLQDAINAGRVGAGATYGLRGAGSSDFDRIMADVGRRAALGRETSLQSLFPTFLQYGLSGEQLRWDELSRARSDWQARQDPLLRYSLGLPGYPAQAQVPTPQPWGASLGNTMTMAPLYAAYLNRGANSTSPSSVPFYLQKNPSGYQFELPT